MSSMGKLMALALVCTMAAAVMFQPVLIGTATQRIDTYDIRIWHDSEVPEIKADVRLWGRRASKMSRMTHSSH